MGKNKEKFLEPNIDIIKLPVADVILTSGGDTGGDIELPPIIM